MRSPLAHLLLALAVLVAVLFGYGAWYTIVSNKSGEVSDLQSQITAAGENMSRIAATRAAFAEIAGDEAKVQSYFVSGSGVVAFINSLEALGLAQKATVSVRSVSTGGSPSRPALLLSITVKGTFDAVMRTLGAIEYAPYDLSISTLSIGEDSQKNWQADVNLIVGSISGNTASTTP
ncbi:MAG: hypothetical protein ACYCZZ_02420 [Minisyncoccota bacterium]